MKYGSIFSLILALVLVQPIASQSELSKLIYGNGYQLGDFEIEGNFNVNNLENIIEAQFSTDGTKYYTLSIPNILTQHDLTIPYDISSASAIKYSFVSTWFDDIRGFYVSPDGTKLFISGDNQFFGSTFGSNIVQFELPYPFDIRTGNPETYVEWRDPFIPCYCEISEISFSYDGLTMYAVTARAKSAIRIHQFALNNPFDVGGLTIDYSSDAGNYITATVLETGPDIDYINAITFDPTGKYFFLLVEVDSLPFQTHVLRFRANTPFNILSLQAGPEIYITNETNAEFFDSMSFNFNGTNYF